jgi:hypothetical protein
MVCNALTLYVIFMLKKINLAKFTIALLPTINRNNNDNNNNNNNNR